MDRSELRRLEKAAREKDKKHLLEWADKLEQQIKFELDREYDKSYEKYLAEMIDTFTVAIAYTLHYSDSTLFDKSKLPDFMEDLYVTVDMFRTKEFTDTDYIEDLKKDGIFIDDIQYSSVCKSYKEMAELKEIRRKYLDFKKENLDMGTKIKCKVCGDILESKHRHDFQSCSCFKEGNSKGCYVDGGNDYMRIGGSFDNIQYFNENTQLWEDLKY